MLRKSFLVTFSILFLLNPATFAQVPEIGGRVVFVSNRDGYENLWILDLITYESNPLTNFPIDLEIEKVFFPKWSNDGKMIAFIGRLSSQSSDELFVVNDNGSNLRQLTNYPTNEYYAWHPQWDPNDPDILYYTKVIPASMAFVHRMNIETGEDIEIPNSSGKNTQYFDITNDSSRILFSREPRCCWTGNIYCGYQDFDGINEQIIKPADGNAKWVGKINRSDSWIVYHEYTGTGTPRNVFKMDSDGNNITQLTFGISGETNLWPTWAEGANDGLIIFESNHFGNSEIVLMNAIQTEYPNGMINLTNHPNNDVYPDWTPVPSNNPPVALCKDIEVPTDDSCEAVIAPEDIDGGSYDPDGDDITLSIDNSGPFPPGDYYVTLTVTDEHGESDTCQAVVTVVDTTPPVPDIAELPDLIGECFLDVTLKPTATDNCAGFIEGTTTDPLFYSDLGTYIISWTYDDGNGNTTAQTQTVIIEDTTLPEIGASVSPSVLWPPNHKMVLITRTVIISDNCDPNPVAELTSITMNEGDETNTYDPNFDTTVGDGNTMNDIQVDENGNIYLRAERSGTGTGRIYTITYTAIDASGNTATATATVTVPHNQ